MKGRGMISLHAGILSTTLTYALCGAVAHAATIDVIVKDTTSPYWQTVMAGACEAGKALGATVNTLGPQSESDIAGQISVLENSVSKKPDTIVLAPTSFDGLGPAVDEAAAAVPVIAVDSKAKSDKFTALLATDNVLGGRLAGEALGEAIAKKFGEASGKVAIISYGPGASTLDDRNKGFKEGLSKYPGLQIVATRIGDFQAATALNQTTDVLTATPDIRGIFADALFGGLGAAQALSEAGKAGQVMIVSFDGNEELGNFVKDGVVYAMVVQDPYQMGYGGVETALKVSKGDKVPEFIDTGVTVITADNLASEKPQKLLKPDLSCLK